MTKKDVPEQELEGTEILQEFEKKLLLKWTTQKKLITF